MKRLISVLTLIFLLAAPAFALSDSEYLKMKRNNRDFARADRALTRVWKNLKEELDPEAFDLLQKNQREWIKTGRDNQAKAYIKEGYSRVEAYTMATNDRDKALPELAEDYRLEIQGERMKHLEEGKQRSRKNNTRRSQAVVKKEKVKEEEEYEDGEDYYDDDDDNFGEIEEERFDGTTLEGNYTRRDKKAFMTVLITDKDTNEAEITVSVKNPEATWSARGWIEDNVLELSDDDYSRCQATLTFSGNSVKFEATKTEDWQEVLGSDIDLSGTYTRSK